jgi:formylglycine-generating enzyme required for sulfatase activity
MTYLSEVLVTLTKFTARIRSPKLLAVLLLFPGVCEAGVQAASTGVRISGRINPSESSTPGSPVPGIPRIPPAARGNEVRLRGVTGGDSRIDKGAVIAPDGSFVIVEVPRGAYQLSVLPSVSIPPVTIVVGDEDILDLELGAPLSRVSGTVAVEGNGPLPRLQLEFTNASDPTRKTLIQTGPVFTTDLPVGRYRVAVKNLPTGISVASISAGSADLSKETFNVGVSQVLPIALALRTAGPSPWVRLSGKVTGAIAGTKTIVISGPASAEALTTTVAPNGAFDFPRVLPGEYKVRILPPAISISNALVVGNRNMTNVEIAAPGTRDIVGEFVKIPPGEFMMGCSPGDPQCRAFEFPVHRVGITKPFEIGKYEVTQAQWEALMGNNPSQFKGRDHPVENINDWVVRDFITKLNALGDGYRYRLPTEAEWEYAARAGGTGINPGATDAIAWFQDNSGDTTHPVGQKRPNAWGLYDVLGNVWELVQDWYSPSYYDKSPALDPQGPTEGTQHSLRGGSWDLEAGSIRVSYRGNPSDDDYTYGFRLVREIVR